MKTFKIISEELMKQETATTMVTKKRVKTVADEVVGKWVIMAQLNNGNIVFGINENKEKAIEEIESQC